MDEKRCSKCGEIKPFSEFNKQKDHKYGLSAHCKKCISEYYKKYRLRINSTKRYKGRAKRLSSWIEWDLYEKLKREARKYDMSVSKLVLGAIVFYFDNYKD